MVGVALLYCLAHYSVCWLSELPFCRGDGHSDCKRREERMGLAYMPQTKSITEGSQARGSSKNGGRNNGDLNRLFPLKPD